MSITTLLPYFGAVQASQTISIQTDIADTNFFQRYFLNHFNFDYFKLGDKNIWSYEWYPELPANRFTGSFTKVVYSVYSTNPDGTDKDQLFRFHVLMYHQDSKDKKFDYLLERQMEMDNATVSGSYYQYTYKKHLDYKTLKSDVIEIVTKGIEPSSRRSVPRRKG